MRCHHQHQANTIHGTSALLPDETPAPSNSSTPVKVISEVMLCFIPLLAPVTVETHHSDRQTEDEQQCNGKDVDAVFFFEALIPGKTNALLL